MIDFFEKEDRKDSLKEAFLFHKPTLVAFSGTGVGERAKGLPHLINGNVFVSSVRKNEREEIVIRMFNPDKESTKVNLSCQATLSLMNEKTYLAKTDRFVVPPKKIYTIKF